MRFCTAINCMDGRVQPAVTEYLREHFSADVVDMITEPGPNALLAAGEDAAAMDSFRRRLDISVTHHGSVGIAIVGHHDCAGNPTGKAEQDRHTLEAMARVRDWYPKVPVVGLWVDDNWQVSLVQES